MLRRYVKEYKPLYWLFEDQTREQYSTSSIQAIFHKTVKEKDLNPWATTHTLRDSFATHLPQQDVSLRHIQELLSHT